MDFNVEAAKKSGYSDGEISAYLAKDSNFDVEGAKKAGYSDQEIISHLSAPVATNQPEVPATNQQLQTDILNPPSKTQRFWNALGKAPGDIVSLPGTLVDLSAQAANTLGQGISNAIGHPELAGPTLPTNLGATIRVPIDQLTGTREMSRPTDWLSQYIETGARLGGNMTIPSGGTVLKAEKPIKAAIQEVLSGLGMTVGTEMGGELGAQSGNEKVGRLIGGLTGGVYPAVAPTRLILGSKPAQKVIAKVGDYFKSPDEKINLAKTAVGEELRKYLGDSPEYAANITAAQNTGIHGFNPNLAQASGAPGVAGLTSFLERKDPAFQAQNFATYKANQKSISDMENQKFPHSDIAPQQGALEAYQAQKESIQTRLNDVNQQMNSLANTYQRQPTSQIGERLRTLRDEQMGLVKKVKDQNYSEVSQIAKDTNATTDKGDLVKFVQDTIKADPNRFQGPNMPGIFDQILGMGKKTELGQVPLNQLEIPTSATSSVHPTAQTPTMSFDELMSLRQRANQEWNASRAGTDPQRTYYLGQLKDQINQKVEAFKDPQYGDLAQKLTEADKFYNQSYRIPFREGAGGRMPYSNRFGEVTPDEQIVSKLLFTPGTKKGIDDFYSIYGDHPEANSLLRKGVLDEFAANVVKEGKDGSLQINPKSVDSFFNKYHETFTDPRISDIKSQLMDSGNAAKLLQQRRIQIIQDRVNLNKDVLTKIYKTENPESLMDQAIKSPQMMDRLITTAKTPENSQALSFGVAEAIKRQSDPYQFLMDNQKSLEPALNRLNPGHFNNLKTIANGMKILDRAPPIKAVEMAKLQDPLQELTGVPAQGLLSRGLNIAKGYMGESYAIGDIAMRKLLQLGETERKQVLEAALNNPKLAKDLADTMKGVKTPELKNKMSNHLISLGVRSVGTENNYPSQPIKEGSQIDPSFFQGP